MMGRCLTASVATECSPVTLHCSYPAAMSVRPYEACLLRVRFAVGTQLSGEVSCSHVEYGDGSFLGDCDA
jgi:hypothetical protein